MELLPCPFCGINSAILSFNDCVKCDKCDFYVKKETWNTRPSQWISVKDRLPENENRVLAVWDDWIDTAYCTIFIDGPYWINSEIGCELPVTHWMPLPTPLKETINE